MVATLFLGGTSAEARVTTRATFVEPQDPAADPKAEYEKRKKDAEGSVDKLWKLYDWCEASGMKPESARTLRAILKVDPDEKHAHELLGHVLFEGKWFDSDKKVEEYKKKQLEASAKASGKVVYKGELVDPADIPFLEKGMTKDADGKWVDTETQKKLAEGWVRQDQVWIPPAEAANVAKGLWKCGDKWLPLAEADKFHSEVTHWWTIANERFVVYSTCTRKNTEAALEQYERAYRDLARIYGKTPQAALPVILLSSKEQYSSFATGNEGISPVEVGPNPAVAPSSLHGAFLADALAAFASGGQTMPGVSYWDTSNAEATNYSKMFARHAEGQAYGEALDQSPKAVAKLIKGEGSNSYSEMFWKEKQLPQWFRYGAAAYAERYLVNSTVAAGGNPNELRDWSVTNITNKGGLDPIDRILKFEVTPDNSGKLINEAGLLVAFALDGKCVDVLTKLGAMKEAVKNNKDISKAAQALADEIKKNESKLRIWASL
jgi:hypothetical protein